jgi:hypothetical protein
MPWACFGGEGELPGTHKYLGLIFINGGKELGLNVIWEMAITKSTGESLPIKPIGGFELGSASL